jgi:dihydrofolate reductase
MADEQQVSVDPQLVQIYAASSVDGYLAPSDGSVAWLEAFDEGGIDLGYDSFYGGVGSIISGRITYEQVLTFGNWPYEGKPVVVLSTREPGTSGPGVRWNDGSDLTALVADLRREAKGNVWLLGGGAVHRAFLAAGLVDELWTHVIPVMLGDGIRMFPAPYPTQHVKLVETRTYANDAVMLRYAIDGAEKV